MKVIQNKAVLHTIQFISMLLTTVQNVYRYGTTVLKMNPNNLSVCVSDVRLLQSISSPKTGPQWWIPPYFRLGQWCLLQSISSTKAEPQCSRWIPTIFPFETVKFTPEYLIYENWITVLQFNADRLSLCASDAILNAVGCLRTLLKMKSDHLWR